MIIDGGSSKVGGNGVPSKSANNALTLVMSSVRRDFPFVSQIVKNIPAPLSLSFSSPIKIGIFIIG